MSREQASLKPDIIAEIQLYPTEAGGRSGPTPADKFGCLFEIEGEYFDCRLLLEGVGALSPGQTATVPIMFLRPDLVHGSLTISRRFHLWDGKRIADGQVKEQFPLSSQ